MGLDAVELVLRIEDELGLELPGDELAVAETVGQTYALVVRAYAAAHHRPFPLPASDGAAPSESAQPPVSERYLWDTFVAIIAEELSIRPERVTPAARWQQDLGLA